jgi:serine/threonine protein kinase
VKVSDFGFASRFEKEGERVTFHEYKGTRKGYMAPEIHYCQNAKDRPYEADKCDIFALGVILFALVMGTLPFELAVEENKLYKMIAEQKFEEFWKCHLQAKHLEDAEGFRLEEFQELFQKMVSQDPKERPSAKEVLKCSWIL